LTYCVILNRCTATWNDWNIFVFKCPYDQILDILKNTTQVEIITAISTAIHIKNNKNFGSYIHAISILIVITISTRVVFLSKGCHFLNSQPRLGTRKINGGRKFSEIKI